VADTRFSTGQSPKNQWARMWDARERTERDEVLGPSRERVGESINQSKNIGQGGWTGEHELQDAIKKKKKRKKNPKRRKIFCLLSILVSTGQTELLDRGK